MRHHLHLYFGQGPNDFGPITGANNNIYNGTFLVFIFSPWNSWQNNTGVKINNCHQDYEVVALALNNADDLLISKCYN